MTVRGVARGYYKLPLNPIKILANETVISAQQTVKSTHLRRAGTWSSQPFANKLPDRTRSEVDTRLGLEPHHRHHVTWQHFACLMLKTWTPIRSRAKHEDFWALSDEQAAGLYVSDVCVWTPPRYKVLSCSWDASATLRIRVKFRELWQVNEALQPGLRMSQCVSLGNRGSTVCLWPVH